MREQLTRNFYLGAKSDPQSKQPGEMLAFSCLKYAGATHPQFLPGGKK
jgi:hypothetical protein